MTGEALLAIVRGIAPVVRDYVTKSHTDLAARIDHLQIAERTIGDLVKANGDLLKTVAELREQVTEVGGAMDVIHDRVAHVEARSIPRYRKGYAPGDPCVLGEMVTYQGSLWHCNDATTQKPGESHDWTLVCKKGRDGKDAGGAK